MQLSSAAGRLAQALEQEWEPRANQVAPAGDDWSIWLILAGRGWGKTLTGAKFVCEEVESGRAKRVHFVAATASDARSVMIEGPSGIIAAASPTCRPTYEPSRRQITWPNGAVGLTFSGEESDRLRGPQCDLLWADELAAWQDPVTTWDMAMLGLRLGRRPRAIATTTPRPIPLIRSLLARDGADVVVTRGATFENEKNLAPSFLTALRNQYENTRLGRQEVFAEVLDDVPGAMWSHAQLDALRVNPEVVPQLTRIVVAVDPSGAAGRDDTSKDEIGIVVAGLGMDGHGYVLEDVSLRDSPANWGKATVAAFYKHKADRIIAEQNFGGEMVRFVIQAADANAPVKLISASRGKAVRAEPVSALYEQGKVHHVKVFPTLEDQLCSLTPGYVRGPAGSPDRADALVWAITELMASVSTTGIIEFYRREAEKLNNGSAPPAPETLGTHPASPEVSAQFGYAFSKEPAARKTLRLRAPSDVSTVYTEMGRRIDVDETRIITVTEHEAKALLMAQWTRVEETAHAK